MKMILLCQLDGRFNGLRTAAGKPVVDKKTKRPVTTPAPDLKTALHAAQVLAQLDAVNEPSRHDVNVHGSLMDRVQEILKRKHARENDGPALEAPMGEAQARAVVIQDIIENEKPPPKR